MLKKIMALAATTAMLGANAAAYALNTVRTAVRTVTGASNDTAPTSGLKNSGTTVTAPDATRHPVDGKSIQPSIPPFPKESPATQAVSTTGTNAGTHKGAVPNASGHKANRVKPRIRKQAVRKR